MTLLVVDDDPHLRSLLTLTLERVGYDVMTASDGQQALTHAARHSPQLIILDVGLPEMDGFEVCRKVRARSQVPILFLTARDDEIDRIVGLELGADDYVTKPFSPRELVARVAAILKRTQAQQDGQTLQHGALTLDLEAHVCTVDAVPVALTQTEIAILAALMRQSPTLLPRTRLVDGIWGAGSAVSDRTLDSHLRNLRRKLADAGAPEAIETVHGVGLRLRSAP